MERGKNNPKNSVRFLQATPFRTAVAAFHDGTKHLPYSPSNVCVRRDRRLCQTREGRWGFISFLKLLELCTHTRVIIIIIVIRTVRKRDVFLRIFLAPVCLPRTHHKIYIHTLKIIRHAVFWYQNRRITRGVRFRVIEETHARGQIIFDAGSVTDTLGRL